MQITHDIDLILVELMMETILRRSEPDDEKYFVPMAPRFNLWMLQHSIHLESWVAKVV